MFVDGVVENLENHVMQTTLIRIADVHSGSFSDSLQPLEFIDLSGIVFLALADAGGVVLTFPIVRIFVVWKRQNGSWHI